MAGENVVSHARRHSMSASSDTPEIQETDAQSKTSSKGVKLSSSVGDKDSGGGKATNSMKAATRRTTGGKKSTVPPTSQAPRHKKQQQQNTSTKKVSSSLECSITSTDDVANISGSAETSVESSPSLTPVQNESLSSVRIPHGSACSEMFSNHDASLSEDRYFDYCNLKNLIVYNCIVLQFICDQSIGTTNRYSSLIRLVCVVFHFVANQILLKC